MLNIFRIRLLNDRAAIKKSPLSEDARQAVEVLTKKKI